MRSILLQYLTIAFFVAIAPTEAAASEWTLLGRYAQGGADYSTNEQDTGFLGHASAIVDLLSVELRWREEPQGSKLWKFTWSFNVEMLRQQVLTVPVFSTKARARVAYGRESFITERWRMAPTLQLSGGREGFFHLTRATKSQSDTIFRESIALGAAVNYRLRSDPWDIGGNRHEMIELSALGLLRADLGSPTVAAPSPILTSFGYEAELSFDLWLSRRLMVEGRFRLLEETFSWVPSNATGANSSFSQTFEIFDVGVGIRF